MQRKWRVSLIVSAGVFMSSLDLFIVNIAFPSISRHFGGASLGSLSWVLSGYAIVFAALLVPAGRWADAFGRKRAFLLGLGIFVAASAACALAPSVGFLIAARIVQAAGGVQGWASPNPFTISDLSNIWVLCDVYENDLAHVNVGQYATDLGGQAAKDNLLVIVPAIDVDGAERGLDVDVIAAAAAAAAVEVGTVI